MSEFVDMIDEASAKLFAPYATPDRWRAAERDEGFGDIWFDIEASGFLDILCVDDDDADEAGAAAFTLIRNAGRALLPAPLGETMLVRAVLSGLRMEALKGPLILTDKRAAYGRYAKSGIGFFDNVISRVDVEAVETKDVNAAGEPRDTLKCKISALLAFDWSQDRILAFAALIRAAQMAGALERVLMLTVDYARTRKQFGKPIGQFQAIQQQLAILAGQTASASVAAAHAFRRWRHQDFVMLAAAAKIRAGEAAGAAISIAHQTHGAIGITYEHELHFATRRLHAWRTEFGAEAFWAGRLGIWAAELGPEDLWARITKS